MPSKAQKAATGRLIGYARVSTEDQGTDPQTDELRAAGCTIVREEHASGADRARPGLARLLRDIAAGDPVAICKVLARRDATWLPIVRRIRPAQPWGDVVRVLNQKPGAVWTVERLRRTVRRLAAEGIVKADLLDRARPQGGADRLVRLVAGIRTASPDWTLQQIASQLEAMRERTPRGGTRWHRSSVQQLLAKAERLRLNEMAADSTAKVTLRNDARAESHE